MTRSSSCVIALVLLASCGDDGAGDGGSTDASMMDARADASGDAGDAGFVVPIAPAPPNTLPCPAGFQERPLESEPSIVGCVPYASGEPDVCGPFEAHFPGEPGCARIGTACPSDGWPTDVVPASTIFVDASAAAGGDGSMATPYATLTDALDAVAEGGVIALRAGTYTSTTAYAIAKTVRIVGACAEGTHVVVRRTAVGVLAMGSATVTLENLAIQGILFEALGAEAGATMELADIVVFETLLVGVHARGGLVRGDSVLVRDIGDSGTGVRASASGSIELRRLAIVSTPDAALAASDGRVDVSDLVIDQRGALGRVGARLDGGEMTLERVGVYGAVEMGIVAIDGSLTVHDAHVRGTTFDDAEVGATAVGLISRGSATIERLVAEDNAPSTVTVSAPMGELVLRDSLILTSRPDSFGRFGRAVEISAGAHATLERVALADHHDVAILVRDPSSSLDASDLLVVDTLSEVRSGTFGRAIHVQSGASAVVRRAHLAHNREVAASASGTGSTLALEDAVIVETLPRACAATSCPGTGAGIGLAAIDGAMASVARFDISRHALAGVQLASGGTVDLSYGLVSENPVGANVQTEPFDATRLSDHVTYRDNGQNLDASRLTVPDPAVGL